MKKEKHKAEAQGISEPKEQRQKKRYAEPQLVIYGTVREITQNVALNSGADSSILPNKSTII